MPKTLPALSAALTFAIAGGAQAAPLLTAYLTYSPATSPFTGVYNVDIYAKVTGTTVTGGDGGIAGFQFDIVSLDNNARPLQQQSAGPNAVKAKTTFDSAITPNFATILPAMFDGAGNVIATGSAASSARRAIGGSFYDATAFANTTLGLNGFARIATEQWQFVNLNTFDWPPLSLNIIGATSYDFGNVDNNFHDDIPAVTILPEPAGLTSLALAPTLLPRRRRRNARPLPH